MIFAKAPFPGRVKTRLIPLLGAEGAARLHEALVLDTLERTQGARGLRRWLACAPAADDPFFSECAGSFDLERITQRGEDLGLRMANAIRDVVGRTGNGVVLIGTDSPTLPPTAIDDAAHRLGKSAVVLGPSTDGGYYLIATARTDLPIFDRMEWGGPRVLSDTLRRLRDADLSADLLPFWYDVDTLGDLAWLAEHIHWLAGKGGEIPRRTAEILKRFNEGRADHDDSME